MGTMMIGQGKGMGVIAALACVGALEVLYSCAGDGAVEEFIEENVGETTAALYDYDQPQPPLPVPGVPQFLNNTPFSESLSVGLSWLPGSSPAASYYAIEQSANGGAWSQVSSTTGTSAQLTTSAPGLYAYRVRACSTNGCSGYVTGNTLSISYGPDRGPGAPALSAAVANGTSGLSIIAPVANGTSGSSGGHPASLGMGYDELRNEWTSNCFDTTGMVVLDQPARYKTMDLSIVTTRSEFSSKIDNSSSLSVSAKYGNYSARYTGTKSLIANTSRIESTSIIVVSLYDQFHMREIQNRYNVPVLANQSILLRNGQPATWRNHCGDSFVHAAYYGRQAYVTVQLTSHDYSDSTIQQQTTNLKADVGTWVSGSYSETKKQEITNKYNQYNVVGHVISYGSSVPVTDAAISLTAAMDYMRAFENEVYSASNEYPIAFETTDYAALGSLPQLPDYRPYRDTLDRWYNWDAQLATRCEMFDDNLNPTTFIAMNSEASGLTNMSLRDACYYMKQAVQQNIQRCEDTTKWSQCIQPDNTSCTVSENGTVSSLGCLPYANRFPRWQAVSATATLSKHHDGGTCCRAVDDDVTAMATLPSATILDRRILGSVSGDACPPVLGSVVVVTDSANNASNPWNTWEASTRTLKAGVHLHKDGFYAAGAWIDQNQTVYGLQSVILSYLF